MGIVRSAIQPNRHLERSAANTHAAVHELIRAESKKNPQHEDENQRRLHGGGESGAQRPTKSSAGKNYVRLGSFLIRQSKYPTIAKFTASTTTFTALG